MLNIPENTPQEIKDQYLKLVEQMKSNTTGGIMCTPEDWEYLQQLIKEGKVEFNA